MGLPPFSFYNQSTVGVDLCSCQSNSSHFLHLWVNLTLNYIIPCQIWVYHTVKNVGLPYVTFISHLGPPPFSLYNQSTVAVDSRRSLNYTSNFCHLWICHKENYTIHPHMCVCHAVKNVAVPHFKHLNIILLWCVHHLLHFTTSQLWELTPVAIWATLYLCHSLSVQNLVNGVYHIKGDLLLANLGRWLIRNCNKLLDHNLSMIQCQTETSFFLGSFRDLIGKSWSFEQFSRNAPSFSDIEKKKMKLKWNWMYTSFSVSVPCATAKYFIFIWQLVVSPY